MNSGLLAKLYGKYAIPESELRKTLILLEEIAGSSGYYELKTEERELGRILKERGLVCSLKGTQSVTLTTEGIRISDKLLNYAKKILHGSKPLKS